MSVTAGAEKLMSELGLINGYYYKIYFTFGGNTKESLEKSHVSSSAQHVTIALGAS